MRMADGSEYFTVGSQVAVTNIFNQIIEGEVVVFDPTSKLLVLKTEASNKQAGLNDLLVVNFAHISDVKVVVESTEQPSPLPKLNIQRLTSRAKNAILDKQRMVKAVSAGTCQEAQQLFLAITKTLNDVSWSESNIVVMNKVVISPPYIPESCSPVKDDSSCTSCLNHVRKIVEKHLKDQQRLGDGTGSPTSSTSNPSTPQSGNEATPIPTSVKMQVTAAAQN